MCNLEDRRREGKKEGGKERRKDGRKEGLEGGREEKSKALGSEQGSHSEFSYY